MYIINCINGAAEYPLLELDDAALLMSAARISETINKTGTMTFTIPSTNINYDKIQKLESEIVVIDLDGDNEIFRGRVMTEELDMYNNKTCTCEGCMAYLLDSQYPPYVYTGSISLFLKNLLDSHNAKVKEKQRIYLGNVTVVDPNDYFRRESQDYGNTLSIIQDKVVETYSGLLNLRRVNGRNYLDYLADYPESDQVARLEENILDLNKCIKAETVRTVIIPLGAEINEETGERLKIGSANGGVDYLVDTTLVEKYGWIEGVVEFDDVTLPENLLRKGREYLSDCKNATLTIELNMVDGRLMGLDVRRLRPGMLVKVESDFHGLDTYFLCTSKETDLLNPESDKIVLGNQFITYTDAANKAQKDYEYKVDHEIKSASNSLLQQIQATKNEFNEAMKNASGLYMTEVKQDDGSTVYYYHNKQQMTDSDILMTFNSEGFGVSADGGQSWYGLRVNGDLITNLLTATGINAEWINAGYLSADRIRTGKMYSADYKEKESGVMYDLDKSTITSYWITVDGKHMRLQMARAGISVTNMDATNSYISMDAQGVTVSTTNYYLGIFNGNTIQISKRNGNSLSTILSISNVGLTMYDGTNITIMGTDQFYSGQTGRAEFSDGTYLTYRNGVLVGGNTLEGGAI